MTAISGLARELRRKDRREAVVAHDGRHSGQIGRAAGSGIEDRSDIEEVRAPEEARGDYRKRGGGCVTGVVEAVNCTARDDKRLARADVRRGAPDRPGEDAVQAVDRLLVAVVAVRNGDLRACRNVEFEQ